LKKSTAWKKNVTGRFPDEYCFVESMSRHRNVKQLVEDDYYDDDDYDDDDYYDDYDDGYSGGNSTLTASKSKSNNTKKVQPQSKPKVSATTTINKRAPQQSSSSSSSSSTTTPQQRQLPTNTTANNHVPAPPQLSPPPPPGFHNHHHIDTTNRTMTEQPLLPPPPPSTTTGPTVVVLEIPSILLRPTKDDRPIQQNHRIPLTVVVLGHVDAGKSTITGHLLSGGGGGSAVQQRNHRSSNTAPPTNYAWMLDEDEQERVHGVTMDIATKPFVWTTTTTPHHPASSSLQREPQFDIVLQDAPGHADYVPAMITGTAAADVAMLCVDATDVPTALGTGQLREHAYLARGLGVNQILIVLNKMDVVGWDQSTVYQNRKELLMDFLIQQVGYPPSRVRCIPLSGLTGTNIFPIQSGCNPKLLDDGTKKLRLWYNGPTLVEALDTFEPPASQQLHKSLEKPLRIIVSDVIESSGGVSIRAKVVSGWVKQGETILVLPVGDNAVLSKFNSLHTTQGLTQQQQQQQQQRRQYCAVGEILDCVIAGLDAQRISIGSILVRSSSRPPITARCRARIYLLDSGGTSQVPLIRGAQMIFHMHHLDVPCHVTALIRTLKPDGMTTLKERPRAISKNCTAMVELLLAVPICMEAFSDCRALGRFVLRRNGDSIAVGRVEQILA
jgi:elongation factor 1 alpha-like protein